MTGDSSVGMEDLERRLWGGDPQALAMLFSRERERLWRLIQSAAGPRPGAAAAPTPAH